VGTELFHVESKIAGHTDGHDEAKQKVTFHNFMNISGVAHFLPKKGSF